MDASTAGGTRAAAAASGKAIGAAVVWGAVAGVAASLIMAMYAMIAAAT